MKIPFHQLIDLAKQANFSAAANDRFRSSDSPPYTDTDGFHIYADLEMPLVLSAGNAQAAARNLKILQAFASASDAVFSRSGLQLLEDQGQRLHFFQESGNPKVDFDAIIGFCRLFYKIAKKEITKLAGGVAFQIRMAGDYGRAILLRSTGDDSSESLISLGNPANRPAKFLARLVENHGVPAGTFAFNAASLSDPDADPYWEHHDLEREEVSKTASAQAELVEAANSAFGEMINFANKQFEPNPGNPVAVPVHRSGFMFRADLDGFSAAVKDAMASDDDAIFELVEVFSRIMKYPSTFKDTLPEGVSVLCFPWAGDCANLFLECDNYRFERESLPSVAALSWHQPQKDSVYWQRLFNKARWVVAAAGGDQNNGHGAILSGNVFANNRTFHVGAGWSWARSLSAEQSKGTTAGDTVIQQEDFSGLDTSYRAPYTDHPYNPSLYKKASLAALVQNASRQKQSAAVSAPAIIIGTSRTIPAPRPYSGLRK